MKNPLDRGVIRAKGLRVDSASYDPSLRPIIFFDGYCGLCDRFVSRVVAHPRAGGFRFAPLQGDTFRALPEKPPAPSNMDSLLVYDPDSGRIYCRSDATIFILSRLGGGSAFLAAMLRCIPAFLRNAGYRMVAASRYRFFGKRDTCRLPAPSERALFLP